MSREEMGIWLKVIEQAMIDRDKLKLVDAFKKISKRIA